MPRRIAELELPVAQALAQGTARYSPPEVHAGEGTAVASEQFSLGVILYELLTGQHPYGESYGDRHQKQRTLRYQSALAHNPLVPPWLDAGLERCLSVLPEKRYPALSHWLADLRNPRIAHQGKTLVDRIERYPGLTLKTLFACSLTGNLILAWLVWF